MKALVKMCNVTRTAAVH